MPTGLVDIGANLGHSSFQPDLPAVLDRARAAGVGPIIVTGTSIRGSRQALELAKKHPGTLYATAGIHPHDAKDGVADDFIELEELQNEAVVLAAGETGLDFNRNYSAPEIQVEVFEKQLLIACRTGLPAFLHQRDAHDVFFSLLKKYRHGLSNVVVHCFTGTAAELSNYLSLDCHIGITGWICDERRGRQVKDLVRDIPLDRLMIETDAPYLLPRDIRPKPKNRRNEPAHLKHIAEVIATDCFGMAYDELVERLARTSRLFFSLRSF